MHNYSVIRIARQNLEVNRTQHPARVSAIETAGFWNGDWLCIEADKLEAIERKYAPEKLAGKSIHALTEEGKAVISARLEACQKCDWQKEWFCEHPACPVCPGKQRQGGGLKTLAENLNHKCPIGRWSV